MWAMAMVDLIMWDFGGMWKILGFGARKTVECCILVESWKTAVLKATWTMEAQLERFSRGSVLATWLETILMIFWPKLWLLFSLILMICPRLSQNVMN